MCCSRQEGPATAGSREVNKLGMANCTYTVLNVDFAKLPKILRAGGLMIACAGGNVSIFEH